MTCYLANLCPFGHHVVIEVLRLVDDSFSPMVAPCISKCKAVARCPPLLIKEAVGPTEYGQFRTKKKNGALDALRGHRTERLAGILADIGSDFKSPSTRLRSGAYFDCKISEID
jgi:hypothetical protein